MATTFVRTALAIVINIITICNGSMRHPDLQTNITICNANDAIFESYLSCKCADLAAVDDIRTVLEIDEPTYARIRA